MNPISLNFENYQIRLNAISCLPPLKNNNRIYLIEQDLSLRNVSSLGKLVWKILNFFHLRPLERFFFNVDIKHSIHIFKNLSLDPRQDKDLLNRSTAVFESIMGSTVDLRNTNKQEPFINTDTFYEYRESFAKITAETPFLRRNFACVNLTSPPLQEINNLSKKAQLAEKYRQQQTPRIPTPLGNPPLSVATGILNPPQDVNTLSRQAQFAEENRQIPIHSIINRVLLPTERNSPLARFTFPAPPPNETEIDLLSRQAQSAANNRAPSITSLPARDGPARNLRPRK